MPIGPSRFGIACMRKKSSGNSATGRFQAKDEAACLKPPNEDALFAFALDRMSVTPYL